MEIAASFLSIEENLSQNIKQLDQTTAKYLHIDIMDGLFVPNNTWTFNEMNHLMQGINKPKDIHLMVQDVKTYVDDFAKLKPEFITFHLEAVKDAGYMIDYIKNKNIKVGISIKPTTDLKKAIPYLSKIDLFLIMSVEPGYGKQKFIETTEYKIEILKNFKDQHNYHFLIEVDGGINNETINKVKKADVLVIGSYITNSPNYQEQINKLNI